MDEKDVWLLPRFVEPPEGTITKICYNCMSYDTLVEWDDVTWGFHCVDIISCLDRMYTKHKKERQDG